MSGTLKYRIELGWSKSSVRDGQHEADAATVEEGHLWNGKEMFYAEGVTVKAMARSRSWAFTEI